MSLAYFFSWLPLSCCSCGARSHKRPPCPLQHWARGEKTSAGGSKQPAAAAAATWDQPQHLPGDDRALRGEHDGTGYCRLRSESCAGERFHLHSPQPVPPKRWVTVPHFVFQASHTIPETFISPPAKQNYTFNHWKFHYSIGRNVVITFWVVVRCTFLCKRYEKCRHKAFSL